MRCLAQLRTSGPQRAGLLSVLAFLCLGTTTSYAQAGPFAGEWILEITQGSTVQTGLLAIEETDDGLVGFVENGPIALAIEGDRISMAIDSRNATGGALERHLEGVLTGTRMSGEFGPPADAPEEELLVCRRYPGGCVHPSGTWQASPYVEVLPESTDPAPVDLSGRWGGTSGSGMLKWTSSLTPAGLAWRDAFNVDLDLPSLRCASRGVFAVRRSAPEIFQQDHKITFVTGNVVRRIYMDGREPPEFFPSSAMGFSSGHWEGDHLVVETTHLSAGVKGYMGGKVFRKFPDAGTVLVERGRDSLQCHGISRPGKFPAPPPCKGRGGPDKARIPFRSLRSATWIRSSVRSTWMASWRSTLTGPIVDSEPLQSTGRIHRHSPTSLVNSLFSSTVSSDRTLPLLPRMTHHVSITGHSMCQRHEARTQLDMVSGFRLPSTFCVGVREGSICLRDS